MAVLATVCKVLYQPIKFPRLPQRQLPWMLPLVQFIQQLDLDRSLRFGEVLSFGGIALFLIAAFLLQDTAASYFTFGADVHFAAGYWLLQAAGWFVTCGWLLQRCENKQWPFDRAMVRILTRFSSAARKAKRRPDITFSLMCLSIITWALWSILR